jgi:hypothetical protein
VQTFVHISNQSGTFGPYALDAFKRHAFVVVEKDQGRWPLGPQPPGYVMEPQTNAEAKIAAACEQVKAATGGQTECYMYTEVEWARTQYSLGSTLDAMGPSVELSCAGKRVIEWDNDTCFHCLEEGAVTAANSNGNKGNGNMISVSGRHGKEFHMDKAFTQNSFAWAVDHGRVEMSYMYGAYDFRSAKTRELWVNRVVGNLGRGGGGGGERKGMDKSRLPTCPHLVLCFF